MALEKSVLTLAEAADLIKNRYSITNIQYIHHIANSSANCYHIICSDRQYFLKEIQSSYSLENAQNEYAINKFLKERAIPTTEFCKTTDRKYVWEYKNHVFHLQNYISGITYGMNSAPQWLINDSVILLGKIHKKLMNYPKLDDGFGEKFFSQWNVTDSIKLYEGLIANFKFNYNKFTVLNSHGDYSILQILCKENSIKAVIDFTSACSLPVCWELIRSYTYADPNCKEGKQIDIENLKNYLKLYLKFIPLNSYDIKMMPYLYYYHLARSRFGYKEYLLSPEKKNDELIKFAFWRTNMCGWLNKNVDLLSSELLSTFSK